MAGTWKGELSALSITSTQIWTMMLEAAKCTTQNACLTSSCCWHAETESHSVRVNGQIQRPCHLLDMGCGVWAHSCTMGECVSEASLTSRHHALAQGRYATMAERGKAGAVLIGARVTGAASPGFDVQTGKSGARSGFP